MAKHQKEKAKKAADALAKKYKGAPKHVPNRVPAPQEILDIARSSKSAKEIREACETANPFEAKKKQESLGRESLLNLPSISQRLPVIADASPAFGPKTHAGTGKHGKAVTRPGSTGKHSKTNTHPGSTGKHGKASRQPESTGKHSAMKDNASAHRGKHGSSEKPVGQSKKAYSAENYVNGNSKSVKRTSKRKLALLSSGSIIAIGLATACIIIALAVFAPGVDTDKALETTSLSVSQDNQVTFSFIERKEREERQKPIESGAKKGTIEASLDEYGAYNVTSKDIASLPSDKDPFAFALDAEDFDQPKLSSDSKAAMEKVAKRIREADADVSYILIDLTTGRGIAGNIDKEVYGASSFKGIFCTFLCEDSEKNKAGLANEYAIESVIKYSDNDAYDSMRASYGDVEFGKWLSEIGLKGDGKLASDWYPMQSARISSTAWVHVNDYLNSGTELAKWLNDLFKNTSISFIRDGIGGKDVAVRNKAGWYAATYGDYSDWNGTCDAGLIDCNGHTYLMSVMTSLPTSDKANKAVAEMAAAIWNAREDLA